jgi:PKD repeat protein
MSTTRTLSLRLATIAAAAAVAFASLVAVTPAAADTLPANPSSPSSPKTVAADALPTAQHNGVAWGQAVVGNTVYVVGKFTQARPAGAAPGVNAVTRNNILAYNIETGALVSSFAPSLNAQALAITASPDGSRIYVTGDFTTVDGAAYYRIAAFSTATGAVIPSFKPILGSQGRALSATNSTVYVGGTFRTVSGVARDYAAAVNASNGAVTAWAPNPNATVDALVVTKDNSKVVVGGRFTVLAGAAFRGLGAVTTTAGTSLPWAANSVVRNAGTEASFTSLTATSDRIYGTGYVFGSGGNLEGTFSANPDTGALYWIEDCHGDTYSTFPQGDVVYVSSHAHYCGNIGGFPQTDPWTMYYATAFSKAATGTITADPMGYWNFAGNPSPTLLNWFPKLQQGTYTGQGQAGWSVSGNDRYVVYAGEFPNVNGVAQYGLVRFAIPEIAPNKVAPIVNDALIPAVSSIARGEVRLSWTATYDYDNAHLTYKLVRDGATATPIYTTTQYSNFYTRARMGFIDRGLVPGSTHTYRLYVSDGYGNTISRLAPTATVSSTASSDGYSEAIVESEPTYYWPLDEASGSTAYDHVGFNDLTVGTGVTRGTAGPVSGLTASTFSGSSTGFAPTPSSEVAPDVFTVEAWFKTTSSSGGKIIGFGNSPTGTSSNYDRHVYLDNAGRVWFGVHPGGVRTVNSSASFNDGQWHQVTASLGANGMVLMVDGKVVGSRADVTSGQPFTGYWRIGGDNIGGWTNQPSSNFLAGSIGEVAIYPEVLSRTEIVSHYVASGRTSPLPTAPTDDYGNAVFLDDPLLYWRLGEASGSLANDSGANDNDGTYYGDVAQGSSAGVRGTTDRSATFSDNTNVASTSSFNNPTVYSVEAWFQTTDPDPRGKIIGFGNQQSGLSSSYDRHVYMTSSGRVVFGTYTGALNTITSPSSYADGLWHHVVATQSSAGMRLYLDGTLVGSDPQTGAQDYSGYWRVGGDTSWDASGPWFSGMIDEAAVYNKALSASTVADHFAIGTLIAPANAIPTASFTATGGELTASFNASASTDTDGTIASYAWNFGDSTTGTGVSPTHAYSAAGDYTVTLTVTDDDGDTASTTRTVTVTAPAPNQAPVAAFTATTSDLAASFTAAASSDPDGSIAGYAWNFGDGTTGTGVTASRTYAAAGTYSVTLAVTDNNGATTSLTKSVTVTAPPVATTIAEDGFERTVSNGWGSATTGGAWVVSGAASALAVTGGAGQVTLAPGSTRTMTLTGVSAAATDSTIEFQLDAVPTGGGAYTSIFGRVIGTQNYAANVWVKSTGAVALVLKQGTTVLSNTTVTGVTYSPNAKLSLRLQVSGASPTTVKAKVWPTGQAEPAAWLSTVTDSTAGLQAPGSVALQATLSASSTAGTITRIDNFNAQPPH